MDDREKALQEAMRLANSPAGQQLIAMLRSEGGAQLRQAMSMAAEGNYDQAKQLLSRMLDTPEAKQLLDRLGRT